MRERVEARETAGRAGRVGVRGSAYQKREKAMLRRRLESSVVSSRVSAFPVGCGCAEDEDAEEEEGW
jgi:hypothetical protein